MKVVPEDVLTSPLAMLFSEPQSTATYENKLAECSVRKQVSSNLFTRMFY